jgi:hypothetical protein
MKAKIRKKHHNIEISDNDIPIDETDLVPKNGNSNQIIEKLRVLGSWCSNTECLHLLQEKKYIPYLINLLDSKEPEILIATVETLNKITQRQHGGENVHFSLTFKPNSLYEVSLVSE